MNEELLKAINNGNVKRFYNSKPWRRKRQRIFERDNNECQKCKSKGGYHNAECVHHKKHLRRYPHLALVDSNLISLCFDCHNEEHPEKFGKTTRAEKKGFTNKEQW